MNHFLKKQIFGTLAVTAALLAGCSGLPPLAGGGGTETVIGSVVKADGSAASNAAVRLRPADYNPVHGAGAAFTAITDRSGNFSIANVPQGAYTALATGMDRETKSLIPGILVGEESVHLAPAVLAPLAAARIEIAPGTASLPAGFVIVPGTDLVEKIDSAAATVLFDSLPSGMIPSFWFCAAAAPAVVTVLRDSVRAEPGQTVLVANAGWRRAKQIFVNTSPTGAGVTGDVFGFPLLVRLNGASFDFTAERVDGGDIRFTKTDGTPLPFEIERWNSAASLAELWVRLDTVRGNSATQSFFMYWGNPAAAGLSNGGAVFDTLNGFVGAWHLGERGSAAARGNSSQPRYDAAPSNFRGPEHGAGLIGEADSLNGIDEYYTLGSGMADWSQGITYSAWACPASVVRCAAFMDFGNGAPSNNIMFVRYYKTENLWVHIYGDTADGGKTAGPLIALGEWQHFAFTLSGKQVTFYKNGLFTGTDTTAQAIRTVVRSKNFFGKNNWAVPGDSYFSGWLDEIELSSVERSPAWIKLSYETQRPGNAVLTFK